MLGWRRERCQNQQHLLSVLSSTTTAMVVEVVVVVVVVVVVGPSGQRREDFGKGGKGLHRATRQSASPYFLILRAGGAQERMAEPNPGGCCKPSFSSPRLSLSSSPIV